MAFVEMKDVYKRYRTGEIVTAASDGINFTIEKGRIRHYCWALRRR